MYLPPKSHKSRFSERMTYIPSTAIDDTNKTDASGGWFDPFMYNTFHYVAGGQLDGELLRVLNSNLDFALGRLPVIYIENHDHSTLVHNAGDRSHWYKTQPPAISLLTSPGIVLIHSGQEFGEDYFLPESGDGRAHRVPCAGSKTPTT